MKDKALIIIGAGIAGLAAGCYAQMNGYQTQIFEMHTLPGGLCTAWKRSGYTVDGCIHWLMGTSPRSGFYQVWSELGVMQSRRMIIHDEFLRVVGPDGKALIFFSKIDRLEQHLKDLSPADAPVIDEFIRDMRFFSEQSLPPGKPVELMGPDELAQLGARMAPYAAAMAKWSKISIAAFAGRLQDPFLRRALPSIFAPDAAMSSFFFFLPGLDHGDCGVPEGGSLEFARAIEQRYLQLGGVVHYGCRVAKILVEQASGAGGQACSRAAGIRLGDGREYHADAIISAADGRTTLFEMLEGQFVSDGWRAAYEKLPVWDPAVQITLGVRRDLSLEPHWAVRLLDRPVMIGGRPRTLLPVRHFCYDHNLAQAGKSVVQTLLSADYRYWKDAAEEPEHYEAEKQQAAMTFIDQLETCYPGITDDVEVVDVATPLTTERYTGNWQGSIMGWNLWAPQLAELQQGMTRSLPGLDDFYMVGQWAQPGGGLPGVAPAARNLIQILCAHDRKPFVTDVPEMAPAHRSA